MKFSLNWIRDYVSIDITPDQLSHKLTMGGLEIEDIEMISSDKIFELEVTPNRADCLSMIGLAREIAAMTDKKLDYPKVPKIKYPSQKVSIDLDQSKICTRYLGALIEDVDVVDSPMWMQKRLQSMSNRTINNLVVPAG